MKIWTGSLNYLNLFNLLGLFWLVAPISYSQAQSANFGISSPQTNTRAELQRLLSPQTQFYPVSINSFATQRDTTTAVQQQPDPQFPEPKSVLYKSLMIPGWGQIVNKQAWKIPIVYGLLGGVAGYSVYLTKQYHDYRAAYYNHTHDDMRFGPTPSHIPESVGEEELKNIRNRLRNRRDLSYIAFVLAYGLNAIDAYVYAHMRSFDVSEDLSMRANIKPTLLAESSPGLTLSFGLVNKSKTK